MRENRTYGSEGGEAQACPTPIKVRVRQAEKHGQRDLQSHRPATEPRPL